MAMQIVDGDKLDRCLTATADRIREVTGETGEIPFDFLGETGFARYIPSGGGGQYSPRCDVVSTFDWGSLQGYWGFDDVYPTDYPPT